jgi:hypothetical protein
MPERKTTAITACHRDAVSGRVWPTSPFLFVLLRNPGNALRVSSSTHRPFRSIPWPGPCSLIRPGGPLATPGTKRDSRGRCPRPRGRYRSRPAGCSWEGRTHMSRPCSKLIRPAARRRQDASVAPVAMEHGSQQGDDDSLLFYGR